MLKHANTISSHETITSDSMSVNNHSSKYRFLILKIHLSIVELNASSIDSHKKAVTAFCFIKKPRFPGDRNRDVSRGRVTMGFIRSLSGPSL